MNKEDKVKLDDLVQGGEKMLFSAILVSFSAISAIIFIACILLSK
tara:strand:+ start:89 stop:223 length:135 start_codon:yes stop_codon:yes gene_type:complete